MKLDLTYAQAMPAKMIYDFEDAQGHKRTIIVHPNKSVSFHTEAGSIQFDKEMAKDVIALLTQFVETGDIDPGSISQEGVSIADAIQKGLYRQEMSGVSIGQSNVISLRSRPKT